MKSLSVISALLLSASPAFAVHDMNSERLKGYHYGYVYGLGNALCGMAIDKIVKKEYSKDVLSGAVEALSRNPESKPFASDIRQAYLDITEDVACKEVYQ